MLPTLYIANKNYSSWSLRPWVLMRTLGLAFDEVLVPFGSTDFQRFSPTGLVPCLVDEGRTVWDSMGITEYLAERHAGAVAVWPADLDARAWARCAAAEMHAGFGVVRNTCTFNAGVRVALHAWPPALTAQWQRFDALWCEGLARFGGPFLAGAAFSAVDAFFAPVAFRVQTYAPALSPTAAAYAARLRALPAMQDWYDAALAETWRDEAHEAELREAGTVQQDLRTTPAG